MSLPAPYNRITSFTAYQTLYPSSPPPGNELDAELNAIMATLNGTITALGLLENGDGTLAAGAVGPTQISSELTAGFTAPSIWATGTAYTASPTSTVLNGSSMYICLVSHTSGTFATDLAAGNWQLIFNLASLTFGTATAIGVTGNGQNVATNVQTSLTNLDSNKAATSHTHVSSQISDSTAVGRTLLTAANLGAQQTALGLGSLAYLNSVAVATMTGNLAMTGKATQTLTSSQNNLLPTGWAANAVLELTSSGSYNITGFSATTDGDIKIIDNVGTGIVTFTAFDSNSLAANQFALTRPLALRPNQSCVFKYDGTNSYWRLQSPLPSQPNAGHRKNLMVGNAGSRNGFTAPGTPNTQYTATADELVLEDSNGETWRVQTVSVTATLGATTGVANGTDTALAASTGYFFWVIGNPSTNTIAGYWSSSSTAPTLPAGYTFKARVGFGRTNGSSLLWRIAQGDNQAAIIVDGTVLTGLPSLITGVQGNIGTPTWVSAAVTSVVPSTATQIDLLLQFEQTSASQVAAMAAPNGSYGAWNSSTNPPPLLANALSSISGQYSTNQSGRFVLESNNVWYASSVSTSGLFVRGWTDNL